MMRKIKDKYNKNNYGEKLSELYSQNTATVLITSPSKRSSIIVFAIMIITMLLVSVVLIKNELIDYRISYLVVAYLTYIFHKILTQIRGKENTIAREEKQDQRNKSAELLFRKYTEKNNNGIPSFSLYLRPFFMIKKIILTNEMTFLPLQTGRIPKSSDYYITDFESIIAGSFEKFGSIIALDDQVYHDVIGFGRYKIENINWKTAISELALFASIIVIVPIITYDKSGTLWELEYIKNNNLLYKTVFIMPPMTESYIDNEKINWEHSKDIIRNKIGLVLPHYSSYGIIFNLNDDTGYVNKYFFLKDIIIDSQGDMAQCCNTISKNLLSLSC